MFMSISNSDQVVKREVPSVFITSHSTDDVVSMLDDLNSSLTAFSAVLCDTLHEDASRVSYSNEFQDVLNLLHAVHSFRSLVAKSIEI